MVTIDGDWEQWEGGADVYKGAEGPLKQTLATRLKPQSHLAVNTGNKGTGVRKDTLCFKGEVGGGHCPSLRVLKSLFNNKMLRVLHCLETVPP